MTRAVPTLHVQTHDVCEPEAGEEAEEELAEEDSAGEMEVEAAVLEASEEPVVELQTDGPAPVVTELTADEVDAEIVMEPAEKAEPEPTGPEEVKLEETEPEQVTELEEVTMAEQVTVPEQVIEAVSSLDEEDEAETDDLTEEEASKVPAEPIDTTEVPLLFLPDTLIFFWAHRLKHGCSFQPLPVVIHMISAFILLCAACVSVVEVPHLEGSAFVFHPSH